MTQNGKPWLSNEGEADEKNLKDEHSKIANLDEVKEDEKLHGLVDEDHPFPSKGN